MLPRKYFEDTIPPALTTGMLKSPVTTYFEQANGGEWWKCQNNIICSQAVGSLDANYLEWLWVNVLTDRAGAVLVVSAPCQHFPPQSGLTSTLSSYLWCVGEKKAAAIAFHLDQCVLELSDCQPSDSFGIFQKLQVTIGNLRSGRNQSVELSIGMQSSAEQHLWLVFGWQCPSLCASIVFKKN